MSRLRLKKFRVQQPAPEILAKYVKKYTGGQLFHEIDDMPTHSSDYLFGNNKPLVLDLGCGRGEFVTLQAEQNPALNYVGIDVHQKSVWAGVHKAVASELENMRFILGDGRSVLLKFPDESVETIYVLFPPPHMERKRIKRDILTAGLIQEIHRILKTNGEFIFVTDNEPYFASKCKLVKELDGFIEAETSQGFEGGITRFQRHWEKFDIPSSRVRYVKKSKTE